MDSVNERMPKAKGKKGLKKKKAKKAPSRLGVGAAAHATDADDDY